MKKYLFLFVFIGIATVALAIPALQDLNYVLQAPPKTNNELSLYQYLNTLYSRWNTLQITTQEPNGNVEANVGNIIVYKNGSIYSLAVEINSPSGTNWTGTTLGGI